MSRSGLRGGGRKPETFENLWSMRGETDGNVKN